MRAYWVHLHYVVEKFAWRNGKLDRAVNNPPLRKLSQVASSNGALPYTEVAGRTEIPNSVEAASWVSWKAAREAVKALTDITIPADHACFNLGNPLWLKEVLNHYACRRVMDHRNRVISTPHAKRQRR